MALKRPIERKINLPTKKITVKKTLKDKLLDLWKRGNAKTRRKIAYLLSAVALGRSEPAIAQTIHELDLFGDRSYEAEPELGVSDSGFLTESEITGLPEGLQIYYRKIQDEMMRQRASPHRQETSGIGLEPPRRKAGHFSEFISLESYVRPDIRERENNLREIARTHELSQYLSSLQYYSHLTPENANFIFDTIARVMSELNKISIGHNELKGNILNSIRSILDYLITEQYNLGNRSSSFRTMQFFDVPLKVFELVQRRSVEPVEKLRDIDRVLQEYSTGLHSKNNNTAVEEIDKEIKQYLSRIRFVERSGERFGHQLAEIDGLLRALGLNELTHYVQRLAYLERPIDSETILNSISKSLKFLQRFNASERNRPFVRKVVYLVLRKIYKTVSENRMQSIFDYVSQYEDIARVEVPSEYVGAGYPEELILLKIIFSL